jgi:hypothetical protein
MCVVSAVNDFGRNQWPEWEKTYPIPYDPTVDRARADAEKMRLFLELLEKAKKVDTAAGLPNCEDPKKAAFETAVIERLAAVEAMLKKLTAGRKKKKTGKRR